MRFIKRLQYKEVYIFYNETKSGKKEQGAEFQIFDKVTEQIRIIYLVCT